MTSKTSPKVDSCARMVCAPPSESHESPPETPRDQGVEGVGEVTTRPSVVLPMTLNTSSITGTTGQSDSSSIMGRPLELANQDLNGSVSTGTPTTHRGDGKCRLWTRCDTTVHSIRQFWRNRNNKKECKRVVRVLSGQTTKSKIKGLGQISGVTVQSSDGLVTHQPIPDSTRKTTCFTGLKTRLKTCGQRIGRIFGKNGKRDDGVEPIAQSGEGLPEVESTETVEPIAKSGEGLPGVVSTEAVEPIAPSGPPEDNNSTVDNQQLSPVSDTNKDVLKTIKSKTNRQLIYDSLPILRENSILLDDYRSAGGFGVVMAGHRGHQTLALKFCHFKDKQTEDSVKREIEFLNDFRHRNVISYIPLKAINHKIVAMELASSDRIISFMTQNVIKTLDSNNVFIYY